MILQGLATLLVSVGTRLCVSLTFGVVLFRVHRCQSFCFGLGLLKLVLVYRIARSQSETNCRHLSDLPHEVFHTSNFGPGHYPISTARSSNCACSRLRARQQRTTLTVTRRHFLTGPCKSACCIPAVAVAVQDWAPRSAAPRMRQRAAHNSHSRDRKGHSPMPPRTRLRH